VLVVLIVFIVVFVVLIVFIAMFVVLIVLIVFVGFVWTHEELLATTRVVSQVWHNTQVIQSEVGAFRMFISFMSFASS
jgi:hypothetical protein